MRLFSKTRSFISAYPPNELDRIIRNDTLGEKGFSYKFAEENEDGYLCKPTGYHAGVATHPDVTVNVQKDTFPTQVNLIFSLSRFDKISIRTSLIICSVVSVSLLLSSPPPNGWQDYLTLIPSLYIAVLILHRVLFESGVRTCRKIFAQHLRLQKSATPKEK